MLFKNKSKCLSAKPDYIYDEGCLDIINLTNETVSIYGQYVECDNCEFQNLANISANKNTSLLVNTKYAFRMYYVDDTLNNIHCSWSKTLYEHYRYGWNITNNERCDPVYIKEPADDAYLPILSAFIILFFFGTIWYMVKCIYKCTKNNDVWRRYMVWSTELENDLGTNDSAPLVIERPPPIRKHPNRIKSVDVFRGLCIMLMIFVNYGGGQYWFFQHSVWNGLTIADLVFPWFIWLMGLSLTVSLHKRLRRAVPRRQLVFQVIRRSLLLIFFGFVLNSHGHNATLVTLRFPGVLQRIGITYLIVGLLEAIFTKRTESQTDYGRLARVQDILSAWPQWLIVFIIVIIHTCVTFFVNVPNCGRGYLGPGGLHDNGSHWNCTGGVAGYIDRVVFHDHMYTRPTCQKVYETTVDYDPEGILGTLTAVLMVYLGVQAGRILHSYSNVKDKVVRWVCWGIVTALLGGILCKFSKNDGILPVNKNLWSLSFVLVLAGFAFLIHSFLFVVVDILRKWGGRPFFYPGMNSLTLYVGHELFRNTFPFSWKPTNETHSAYLGMNLWGTALWVVISIILYKKNIFLSI